MPPHERIIDLHELNPNLYGFIAIHSTKLGPALGGTRVFKYNSLRDAKEDALRLSSAMTLKSSVSGLPFGGGKAVIVADPNHANIKDILKAFALEIDKLRGQFYTGEDVGLTEKDVQYMLGFSPYFIGHTGLAGDPSGFASLSAFLCLKTAIREVFGSDNIRGKTFAIKGLGKTGYELARLIAEEGGHLIISDINEKQTEKFASLYPGVKVANPADVFTLTADAYVPCALGQDFDNLNLDSVRAKIICGTANNQLKDPEIHDSLYQKNILYVPDYIANAGGLINVADELLQGGYNKDRVMNSIHALPKLLEGIFHKSKILNSSSESIARAEAINILKTREVLHA